MTSSLIRPSYTIRATIFENVFPPGKFPKLNISLLREHVEEVRLIEQSLEGTHENNGERSTDPLTQGQPQTEHTQPTSEGEQGDQLHTQNPGEKFDSRNVCRYYKNGK